MNDMTGLKVGDKVLVQRIHSDDSVGIVESESRTQVTVGRIKFRKRDGHAVGPHSYWSPWIAPATPADIKRVADKELRRESVSYMQTFDSSRWSHDAIVAAAVMLRASVKP